MQKYKIAHIKEQNTQLIVAPLDKSFDNKTPAQQHAFVNVLQTCATSAGLAGTVVPIWLSNNKVKFIAPKNWHPFFSSPGIYQRILANINKELSCS